MDNLRGLPGIRMVTKVRSARIREVCGVTKRLGERIDEGVLRWFSLFEKLENNMMAKKVYEQLGSRPRKTD